MFTLTLDQEKTPSPLFQSSYKKLKRTINLSMFFVLFLTLSGCASIAGDNMRQVSVNSKPAGAAIYVDNQQYGTTPAIVTLPTYIYGGKSITLKKEGYNDHSMMVNSAFQPIALLDIFLWPTFIIDAATGNLVKIDPANRNLYADLQKVESRS